MRVLPFIFPFSSFFFKAILLLAALYNSYRFFIYSFHFLFSWNQIGVEGAAKLGEGLTKMPNATNVHLNLE
jgi:hypothetical protein